MLDRVNQLICEAEANCRRVQGMKISPSTSPRFSASATILFPEVVVVEDNGRGHCTVMVEPLDRVTESSGSGRMDPPREAETASVGCRQPAEPFAFDPDGNGGLSGEGSNGGGGDVGGVHGKEKDGTRTVSGNARTDNAATGGVVRGRPSLSRGIVLPSLFAAECL